MFIQFQLQEDETYKKLFLESLRLRFELLGWLLDSIQSSTSCIGDWAQILRQLVTHGIVDLNNNR